MNEWTSQRTSHSKCDFTSNCKSEDTMQKPSHDKLYEIWELWYDWAATKKKAHPLCHLSRFNLLAMAKDYRKSPIRLNAFKSKLSFISHKKKRPKTRNNNLTNIKNATQTMLRVHICVQNIWQIQRKRRHINSMQNHWPIWEQSPNSSSANNICQATIFHSTKLFYSKFSFTTFLSCIRSEKKGIFPTIIIVPLSKSAWTVIDMSN